MVRCIGISFYSIFSRRRTRWRRRKKNETAKGRPPKQKVRTRKRAKQQQPQITAAAATTMTTRKAVPRNNLSPAARALLGLPKALAAHLVPHAVDPNKCGCKYCSWFSAADKRTDILGSHLLSTNTTPHSTDRNCTERIAQHPFNPQAKDPPRFPRTECGVWMRSDWRRCLVPLFR